MKKTKTNYNDYFKFIEDWRGGKSHQFKSGDVVENKNGTQLGVVQFALATVGQYQVKVRINDKPWEFLEIKMQENQMVKVDKPNPFKYKYSDMIPGPSSYEIDRLNEKLAANDAKRAKEKTAREVEAHIAALEEEISYKKEMSKISEEKDKVVPEEDDDEIPAIPLDPIEMKREKIISEE
jgi:hypothetical protein